MVIDVYFIELVALCVGSALFVLLLLCVGLGRRASFMDVLKVAGMGVYLAVLLQLTALYDGWVLAAGLALPLVGALLYGALKAVEK